VAPRSIAERYVLLALSLGKHVDGLVDGYFGPSELQETVEREDVVSPAGLLDEARGLLALVPHLDDEDFDAQRRRWLVGQLEGLACVAETASGTEVPWRDAVRRCYGIEVEVTDEDGFAAAHERLAAVLPGTGELAKRLQMWNRAQQIPREKVLPVFDAVADVLRERTKGLVELPAGERIDAEAVTGQPWGAYNWYLGNLRSRIEVNVDLPLRSHYLASLVAHEGYPGHHTEHACKEARLVRQLGRIEGAILLIHTPECLVSEGIATLAIERAFGEEWPRHVAEILRPLDVPFDPATAGVVLEAFERLGRVGVNIAAFANEQDWSVDDAVAYHRRWMLSEEDRARKAVSFSTHPVWSVYVPTYTYGYRLAKAYVTGGGDQAFRRLLTEQLTTADLLDARANGPSSEGQASAT
jgi:hypothetical protein